MSLEIDNHLNINIRIYEKSVALPPSLPYA